jgi:hypothetical protein
MASTYQRKREVNVKKATVAFLIIGLGFMTTANAVTLLPGSGKMENSTSFSPKDAPMTANPIIIPLKGLSWGMTSMQLGVVVDAILDDDYRPLYAKVSPGVKMKQLDAALAEEKAQLRRSRIDFVRPPTNVDATVLRGEYSYNNHESLLTLNRKGTVTHFFLIRDRLWKIIEEHKLDNRSPQGVNYQDSVARLSALFGVKGRSIPAGVNGAPEVDWRDKIIHLRATQRSGIEVGFAFEELTGLRANASDQRKKP